MRTQHRNTPPILNYSPLVAAVAMAFVPGQALAVSGPTAPAQCTGGPVGPWTCTVNSGADGVDPTPGGSLREAIDFLNGSWTDDSDYVFSNCTGSDVIKFSGPFTITPSSQLPSLQCYGLKVEGPAGRTPVVHIVSNGLIDYGLYANAFATVSNLEVSGFVNDCGCATALYGQMDAIGNNIHDNSNGIDVWGTSRVDDNTVTANDYGIYVSDSYGGTVSGNKVIGNGNSDGIDIDYSSGLTVANNIIQNNAYGIYIYDGSGLVLDNNSVVSAHSEAYGIDIDYSSVTATNNTVTKGGYGFYVYNSWIDLNHNFVGTDPSSSTGMGNGYGIYVESYSYGSIASNVISGNSGVGLAIDDSDSFSINSNKIGTNVAGTAQLANGTGISAYCLTASEFVDNTVSGNTQTGMELYGVVGTEFGASGGGTVEVRNNRIGVAGDGITALPNSAYGVYMGYGTCYSYGYGATAKAAMAKRSPLRAKLGGTTRSAGGSSDGILFQGNTIASNTRDGLGMSYANSNNVKSNIIRNNGGRGIFMTVATGNQVLENNIYDNLGKNVDLGYSGAPLPNDYGVNDADGGANNHQNYPDLGPIVRGSGVTTVNFTLDSAVGNYRVDVYSNSSSVPGGKVWQGNTNVAVTGVAPVSRSYAFGSTSVDNISLTATRTDTGVPADTSEFSPVGFVQTTPAAVVSPTSIDFGNVSMGGRSGDRAITVQSTGSGAYRIDSLRDSSCYGGTICYGGAFICSSNCAEGTSMAKGTSCTISAAFAPSGLGPYSTTITICDNTDMSPRNIVLTGNGVVPPPVGIDPSSWTFPDTLVGGRSDVKTFVITNPGATSVPIGRVATTGDFALDSTTCGSAIAPGASCDANVVFVPAVQGPADGTLEVSAGGTLLPPALAPARGKKASTKVTELPPGSGATARLSGLGVAQAQVSLPTSLDVGTQTRGEAALSRSFTLTSTGNRSLDIGSITTSAPFAVSSDCPAILPPGNACTITVTYTSNALGTFTGVLNVVTDSATGSGAIPLTGRTIEVASPLLRLSSTNMGFGDRLFGTVSPTQRVTIANVGNSGATFSSIVTSNLDFLITGTSCGTTLAVGAECSVDVAMRPMGFGTRTGLLLVNSNAAGSPHQASLVGTGCRPFTGAGARSGARNNCAP